ncbi:MAG: sugar transferase [Micrococcales bacterium]|nr:sugar transferase [Micrococcales bacterium]
MERAKRVIDVAVAGVALALTSPLQGLVAIMVRRDVGAPVLFRQVRPGLHGEPFELLKFRTMRAVDRERGLVDDVDRLTPLGRRLRSTSLDELPTLWNVLRGDMSLVGPRPLLVEYLTLYSPEQQHRHDVRPGLTGLAQVSGRNSIGWDERLRLDLQYVRKHSLRGDLRIILRTIGAVLRREGITAEGDATMPRFQGSGGERGAA